MQRFLVVLGHSGKKILKQLMGFQTNSGAGVARMMIFIGGKI